MRKLPYILSVIPLLLFADLAHAGDQEDAAATMDAIRAALNTGDVDAAQKLIHDDYDGFESGGSLLAPLDFEGAKAAFAAGLKFNVQTAHSDVTVYGDTAILTEYHMRQITPPGGTPLSATLRATIVMVKQKGQWKAVHGHISNLTPKNLE